MSEAELLESLNMSVSNSLAAYAIFLTLATSYIVVAQLAGKTLSITQTWLLTTLYSIAITIMIFTLYGNVQMGDSLRLEQINRFPRGGELAVPVAAANLVTTLLIYLGTLKYMWDLRRANVE